MTTGIIVIALCLLFVALFALVSKGEENRKKSLAKIKQKMEEAGAVVSHQVISQYWFIAIDETHEKVYFAKWEWEPGKEMFRDVEFADIYACEVILDDQTVHKKSTVRTVGGALIGGALLGGVGAIVGGLSGSSSQKSNIKKAELKITIKDLNNPNYKFSFYDSSVNSALRKAKLEEVEKWKDIFTLIIDRVDSRKKD